MAMPTDPYPSPRPVIRFDVINQAFALFQQQMSQWVVIALVYIIVIGVASLVLGLIPVAGQIVAGVPAMILAGGMYKAALKHIRGDMVAVADLFDIGDIVGPLIVAGILINIGVAIGTLLCILPGFVVLGLWMFSIPLVVDRGMEGVSAMRESWNALRGQWAMAAIFAFVVGLIGGVGILLCGVGVLFTAPIAILSSALLYRDFFPEDAAAGGPSYPPSPI